jgi:hypothetical protein
VNVVYEREQDKIKPEDRGESITVTPGASNSNLEIKQKFTSYNNPKGNADTEKMIRTMKEELETRNFCVSQVAANKYRGNLFIYLSASFKLDL